MSDKKQPTRPFPPLHTAGKNRFPFTLACPSFIYPAGYADNVRHLAPFIDEIQLLFFESQPQSLPSRELIRELANLAGSQTIRYHVHLPSDIYPGHPDSDERRRAADAVRDVLVRCEPLAPSTYTLHLNRHPDNLPALSINRWQDHLIETLQRMLPSDMDHRRISVETLDYPFERVAPVIAALDLSVCMDMGHLMVHGADIAAFFERWRDRITIVHLHGVKAASDHLSLDHLDRRQMHTVLKLLQSFSGVVCLEVYSQPGLEASLAHLVDQWFRQKAEGV